MTALAITIMILSFVLVWGGLGASIVALRRHPDVSTYPPGGADDHREDDAPVPRDT